jgi:hypothetical protein
MLPRSGSQLIALVGAFALATPAWAADTVYSNSAGCSIVVDNTEVLFSGCNLRVVNGAGSTQAVNGKGNLAIGYNTADATDLRTGSHNLVIGDQHSYSSTASLVSGFDNSITGTAGALVAGQGNRVASSYSGIVGGKLNATTGVHAGVVGGRRLVASGRSSFLGGGDANEASAEYAANLGGVGMNANTTGEALVEGVRVVDVSDAVVDLQDGLDTVSLLLADVADYADATAVTVAGLSTTLAQVQTDLDAWELAALAADALLDGRLSAVEASVADAGAAIAGLGSSLSGALSDLGALAARITGLESANSALAAADAALDSRAGAAEASLGAVDSRLGLTEAELVAVGAEVTALDLRMSAAEADLLDQAAALVGLESEVASAAAAAALLEPRVGAAEVTITSQALSLGGLSTDLSSLSAALDANALADAAVAADLRSQATQLNLAQSDLNSVQTDLSLMAMQILDLQAALTAVEADITSLAVSSGSTTLPFDANEVAEVMNYLSVNSDGDVVFTGANVLIQDGYGATDDGTIEGGGLSGKGNLIVGYNESGSTWCSDDTQDRSGAHNLVLGSCHSYSGIGSLIAGYENEITSAYSSITGGYSNVVNADYGSVYGGSGTTISTDAGYGP